MGTNKHEGNDRPNRQPNDRHDLDKSRNWIWITSFLCCVSPYIHNQYFVIDYKSYTGCLPDPNSKSVRRLGLGRQCVLSSILLKPERVLEL